MKKIKLTQNKYALVDDEDFEELNKLKWCAKKNGKNWYASRGISICGKKINLDMHVQILGKLQNGKETDHKDGNGLNNQRMNLRIVKHKTNSRNSRKYSNNTSGFRGVSWKKEYSKWFAQCVIGQKNHHLGYFDNIIDAAKAYESFVKKHYKKFNQNN